MRLKTSLLVLALCLPCSSCFLWYADAPVVPASRIPPPPRCDYAEQSPPESNDVGGATRFYWAEAPVWEEPVQSALYEGFELKRKTTNFALVFMTKTTHEEGAPSCMWTFARATQLKQTRNSTEVTFGAETPVELGALKKGGSILDCQLFDSLSSAPPVAKPAPARPTAAPAGAAPVPAAVATPASTPAPSVSRPGEAAPVADGPAPQFTLAKTRFRVGETITVSFGAPLVAPAGQQYWITLVRESGSDSEYGSWHYVAPNAATETLKADTAGKFEVRLHDLYPRNSSKVLKRVKVVVE